MPGLPLSNQPPPYGGPDSGKPPKLSSAADDLLWTIKNNIFDGVLPDEFIQYVFGVAPSHVEAIVNKIWRLDSKLLMEYHVACLRTDKKQMYPPYEDLLHDLGRRVCDYLGDPFDEQKLWMHLKHNYLLSHTSRAIGCPKSQQVCIATAKGQGRHDHLDPGEHAARFTRRAPQSSPPPITLHDLEVAKAAVDGMSTSGRFYTMRACINRFTVVFWYYDRSCVIRSISFNFEDKPALLALFAYAMSSGSIRNDDYEPRPYYGPAFVFPTTPYYGSSILGARMMFIPRNREEPVAMFCIDRFVFAYAALVGRGTMVYDVREDFSEDGFGDEEVLKISWPLANRLREAELIEQIVNAIPEWKDHLPAVTFSATYNATELNIPRVKLLYSLGLECIDERHMHVLGMAKYKKLWEVGSIAAFKKTFIDCVECHYHSFDRGRVLHRDLSENNLMFKQYEDGIKGVVNDWDMASPIDSAGDILGPNLPTGTIPYMSFELHSDDAPPHLYRHDLESFFYILTFACVNYDLRRRKRLPPPRVLELWAIPERARALKIAFLVDPQSRDQVFGCVGDEFRDLLEEWLVPLWNLFRRAYMSVPEGKEFEIYDTKTYGGHITFETFMAALGREPLRTSL